MRRRMLVLLIGFVVLLMGSQPLSTAAQSQDEIPAYWRHNASGEITHVAVDDFFATGENTVAVVSIDGTVNLLRGNGDPLWETPLQVDGTISTLVALNDLLVYATTDEIVAIDAQQAVAWSLPQQQTVAIDGLYVADGVVSAETNTPSPDTLLIHYSNGGLHHLSADGTLRWRYTHPDTPIPIAAGQLILTDLNRDGEQDILLSYSTERRLVRLDHVRLRDGETLRSTVLDQFVTTLAVGQFDDASPTIAAGTSRGKIHLLDSALQQKWQPRTLNRTVSSLTFMRWGDEQPTLVVGTTAGKLVGFDTSGQRAWDKVLCVQAERVTLRNTTCIEGVYGGIQALEASGPTLGMLVRRDNNSAETLLIDSDFNVQARYGSTILGQPQMFTDSNSDGRNELLLPTFSSLQLVSAGATARTPSEEWAYPLAARPRAIVVSDLDADGQDDLIIGGEDGRLHRLNSSTNAAVWIRPPEGDIVDIATIRAPITEVADELVIESADFVTNDAQYLLVAINETAEETTVSHVNLLNASGNPAWTERIDLEGGIVSMLVDSTGSFPMLVLGLESGEAVAYDLAFQTTAIGPRWSVRRLWSRDLGEPITAGALLQQPAETRPRFVFTTQGFVDRFDQGGRSLFRSGGFSPSAACGSSAEMIFLLANNASGDLSCLRNRNLSVWRGWLGSSPTAQAQTTDKYLYSPTGYRRWQRVSRVDQGDLRNLLDDEDEQAIADVVEGGAAQSLSNVSAVYNGDLTADRRTDMVLGFEDGRVLLDLNESDSLNASAETEIQLSGAVRYVAALRDGVNAAEPANLVLITDAGFVRLFRFRPNHPPLLTAASATGSGDQFDIALSIFDVESSQIVVSLDLYDSEQDAWIAQSPQQVSDASNSELNWQVAPISPDEALRYRFRFVDAENDYLGLLTPPKGPISQSTLGQSWTLAIPFVVLALLFGIVLRWFRARQRPSSLALRFLHEIARTPVVTLTEIGRRYNQIQGNADFFINLANYARQNNNALIAALADGLYLLNDRPTAGLDILNETLTDVAEHRYGPVMRSEEWYALFDTAQRLLEAPNLTEIGLLSFPLDEMLPAIERSTQEPDLWPRIGQVLDVLKASERVDTVGDRLAYLSDADVMLRELQRDSDASSIDLSTVLVKAIAPRWHGLVRVATESLRGRARVDVRLKTRRVAPQDSAELVLELTNSGLSQAEQINVTLLVDKTRQQSKTIPTLSPGWKRSLLFQVAMPDAATFRITCTITYRDRLSEQRSFEFADMVQVLTPVSDFRPIQNPYSPGTPLRRNSPLFYGRNDLFNFIAGEADRASQQHVLILVGQRRTGKTSALLRLNHHLPDHLVPVYIDCQSLGIVPGMTAFFQDLAWQIADTLDERGVIIDVPDLNGLDMNPAKWFQHTFIPEVRMELPESTKIVLVFDEFEALENLVTDEILPRTIFNFLRHLMQHGEGLSFIFVGTHRLEEMTTDYWSVLFNIALYQEISYLNDAAAHALITEPVAPTLIYDDLALDKILRVTAGHPYFLQLVCYSLVKRANAEESGYVTISDVNATIEEMLGLGEVHFAYIWQRSNSAERTVLLAVTHLIDKETVFRPADILNAIEPYQLDLTPATVTAALDSLVRRNIMRERTDGATSLYEIKLGLVGYWIERSKSLNKLYSRLPSP